MRHNRKRYRKKKRKQRANIYTRGLEEQAQLNFHVLVMEDSASWTSSWWPYLSGSPWTFSPLRSRTSPILNPIIWLTILDVISGSEAWPCLGLQATARVDVHAVGRGSDAGTNHWKVKNSWRTSGPPGPLSLPVVSGVVSHRDVV